MDIPRFRVDKSLPTPAYLQLAEQILAAIGAGQLRPGMALPSERELSQELRLSRMTVRRAFEELVERGQLEQRRGSGTFVKRPALEQSVDRLEGYWDEATRLGMQPGSRLLEAGFQPIDSDVARALGVDEGERLLRVSRLRTANDEPLALQLAFLAPRLSGLNLDRLVVSGSLYRTICDQFGVEPARARQTVAARMPTAGERSLLGIDQGVPVLALERTTFDDGGEPFEFVRSVYRGDRYRMALQLRTGGQER